VTGTPAMKNELKTPVAPLAPAKLFGTVAPLTVVPLIAYSSKKVSPTARTIL
jgi:hypothetical protein